jgi:long-chain acyl-CoA synthetase
MRASETLPRLLAGLAATRPRAVALQEKRYGIWQPMTWAQYAQRVHDFAYGLAELGVQRGDVVAVLGDNRPEWLITELGAQCLGASVVGVYPTSIGDEVRHVLDTAEVGVVVAEDQEQVDKLIRLKDALPKLSTIVYYDPRGLIGYPQPYLAKFGDVEAAGAQARARDPRRLDAEIAKTDPADTAVVCTTSGTTARPKLAELSHANLLAMAEHLTEIDPIEAGYRYVSFLPLAWIGEQMLAVACGLRSAMTLSFPEETATQRADLREIGPDVMFGPPRIWESMLSDVQVRIDEAGWLKRRIFALSYRVGDRAAARASRRAGPMRWAADQVGLRPVRDQLGLARVRRCYTGGAPLSPDVFRFFHAIGVNLKQIYGQTEICGIAVAHRDGAVRFHTVGVPIPGTELRIADDGEVLLRSASVFRRYLHDPPATARVKTADGWLHTGDAGYLDGGELVVIDRQADVLALPDGSRFSSAFIENKLKFSPYVEEAVSFHGPAGITAVICIDPRVVGAWAERTRIGYTTYTDLAGKPEVAELLAEEVARANADLPEPIRVRRFVLLHKQLDPDDDEITRTRKVRRGVIGRRYAAIITALERGEETVGVHTMVAYQDGTRTERTITLAIRQPVSQQALAQRRRRPVWSGRA